MKYYSVAVNNSEVLRTQAKGEQEAIDKILIAEGKPIFEIKIIEA